MPGLHLPNSNKKTDPELNVKVHLAYLDGLRGIAALYVVLFHTFMAYNMSSTLVPAPSSSLRRAMDLAFWLVFRYGHYAVNVFIVLSGYCLMLPVVRSREKQLKGGIRGFVRRRAVRILPAYYAALALSLALIGFVPGMNRKMGTGWDEALPAFTPEAILSHLLLIQHHSSMWDIKINPPMWSVAVEWQIYFVFALLLLPVWRRTGYAGMLIAGIGIGICAQFPPFTNIGGTYPWMLGLFTLGTTAAGISFDETPQMHRFKSLPWGALAGIFGVIVVIGNALQRKSWSHYWFMHWLCSGHWTVACILDFLVGMASVSLILYCTGIYQQAKPLEPTTTADASPNERVSTIQESARFSLLLRLLEAKPLVSLGSFSYSLYLIHAPIIQGLIDHLNVQWQLVAPLRILTLFGIGVPLCLISAWVFHRAFEQPWLRSRTREDMSKQA